MQNQQQCHMKKVSSLEKELAQIKAGLTCKDDTIKKLTADLEYANFQIQELKRMIFGSKRERFTTPDDSQQLSLFSDEQITEIAEEVRKEIETQEVSYQRKKKKKKSPGRMPLPSHLDVVEMVIEPEEDTSDMVCIGQEQTDELDYTPAKLHINRYIRPKYITKEDSECNQNQVIAKLDRFIPKCIASPALLSMIFTDKFEYHLPLQRINKRINQLGVPIPTSTLESWVKLGANLLKPLYEILKLYVYNQIYQMVDESPIKVQDKEKKGKCHQGYMWVRYAPLSKTALFEYYKSRSSNGPIDDLNTFKGYIQTDGYSGYTYLTKLEGLTHLSCWAHARRYFEKALKNDHKRASRVMSLIQVLYSIEKLARRSEMSYIQRYELRLEKALPILNEIGQYIQSQKQCVTPRSLIGKAFEYCANRWISLQNYLIDGRLEIDSNLVENSIRPLALGRKNYLFAGSHKAAQNIAMFYSFFATCKKNDIAPQQWLNYVMANVHKTEASELKYLLPQFIDINLLG